MAQNPPQDTPRVTPHLFYDDVGAAIDWLVKAFDFKVRLRMVDKAGVVVHGDLEVEDSLVMVGLASENAAWISPAADGGKICQRLFIYVDQVDAHHERALNAGRR